MRLSAAFALGLLLSAPLPLFAAMNLDLQSIRAIRPGDKTASYRVVFSECSSLIRFDYGDSKTFQTANIQDLQVEANGSCSYSFSLSGDNVFTPFIRFLASGKVEFTEYSEIFVYESISPGIKLNTIEIGSGPEGQFLLVHATAQDDRNLSELRYSVMGLLASDLRNAGGIIANAASKAFSSSQGWKSVRPTQQSQTAFTIKVPLQKALSQDQLAHDAIVLVDLQAIDASGNQKSRSYLRFTGQDVQDVPLNLAVQPSSLVISNQLSVVQLKPAVNFRYRGELLLPQGDPNITYVSSHPEIVRVTPDGAVYPLRPTAGENVSIRVSYASTLNLDIPVIIDFTQTLDALEFQGYSQGQTWRLSQLNQFTKIPELVGVFNKGKSNENRVTISDYYKPIIGVPEELASLIQVTDRYEVAARQVIQASLGAKLQVRLAEFPSLSVALPFEALDSAPAVELLAADKIYTGQTLKVEAKALDDVGVKELIFYVGGKEVSRKSASPFIFTIDVSEAMAGQTLQVGAKVLDSVGQESNLVTRDVLVQSASLISFPALSMAKPINGSRFIAGTTVLFSVEMPVNDEESDRSRDISYVEFLVDGSAVAQSAFPTLRERRDETGTLKKFRVWEAYHQLPQVAVREQSLSLHAKAWHKSGESKELASSLIRVVGNTRPTLTVQPSIASGEITVGQTLNLVVSVSDDTLYVGTLVQVIVDGQVHESKSISDAFQASVSTTTETSTLNFSIPIQAAWMGKTVKWQIKAVDFHQLTTLSDLYQFQVAADQLPQVALQYPQSGTQVVAGSRVEFRATASDDVGISRVDFYYNDTLMGADYAAPYAFFVTIPEGLQQSQQAKAYAIAIDNAGKQTKSAVALFTVGPDQEAPVINLVSPANTMRVSGQDVAPVIENQRVAIKWAGYDNIGLNDFEVTGIRRDSQYGFVLTGQATDRISSQDVTIQRIPSDIKAWSVSFLLKVPAFSPNPEGQMNLFSVTAKARDASGNESKVESVLGITSDAKPLVVDVLPSQTEAYAHDSLNWNILARDDKAISRIRLDVLLDQGSTPLFTKTLVEGDFLSLAQVQALITTNLRSLSISNANHELIVRVQAWDNADQPSAVFEKTLPLLLDNRGPAVEVLGPLPGRILYTGESLTWQLRVQDSSALKSFACRINGQTVISRSYSGQQQLVQESFSHAPQSVGDMALICDASDEYNNSSSQVVAWQVQGDGKPTVALRSPAAGTRAQEGQLLSFSAQASDDRALARVTFGLERNGISIDRKDFTASEANDASRAGQYLNASLRVPTLVGTATQVYAEAEDSSGHVTRITQDLQIYDDTESPIVELEKPLANFSVQPGQMVQIKGLVHDNVFVKDIALDLLVPGSTARKLDWADLSKQEEIREVHVPDPGTFGQILVSQKHYVFFDGHLKIPLDLLNKAGQQLTLRIQGQDAGINLGTASVPFTVLADTKAPIITFKSPGPEVIEGQVISLGFDLTDDQELASYKVFIVDPSKNLGTDQPIKQRTAIQVDSTSDTVSVDLSILNPVPASGKVINFVLEVSDVSGNVGRGNLQVKVLADQPPQLVFLTKNGNVMPGSKALAAFTAVDDDDSDSELMAVSTSFAALESRELKVDISTEVGRSVRFNYPEAADLDLNLLVNNQSVFQVQTQKAILRPHVNDNWESFKINVPAGYELSWQVEAWGRSLCDNASMSKTIVGSELRRSDIGLEDIWLLRAKPLIRHISSNVLIDWLGEVIWDAQANDWDPSLAVADARRLPQPYSLQLRDGSSSSLLSWSLMHRVTNQAATFVTSARHWAPRAAHLKTFVFGFDRYSASRQRSTQVLLATTQTIDDASAPTVEVQEPQPSRVVRANEQIPFKLDLKDNSEAIRNIEVRIDGNLVRTYAGGWGPENLSFPLIMPAGKSSGDRINVDIRSYDFQGKLAQKSFDLPVDQDRFPELQIKSFGDIKDPARVNYGEFWVRPQEQVNIGLELYDDVALKQMNLYRLASNGSRAAVLFTKSYGQQCPQEPVRKTTELASWTFTENQSTEFELELEDAVGQKSSRRLMIHPLSNVVPLVRILSPADRQEIPAGKVEMNLQLVMTDDKPITQIRVLANGQVLTIDQFPTAEFNQASLKAALQSIYDVYEKNYGIQIAQNYANDKSPGYGLQHYRLRLPDSVIRTAGELRISAEVTDTEGAIGNHALTLVVRPDEIKPVLTVLEPGPAFNFIEGTDLKAKFQGKDNARVARIEVQKTMSAERGQVVVSKLPYGSPLTVITAIPDRDEDPITTLDIDTPVFQQLIHAPTLTELKQSFTGLNGTETFSIWLRFVTVDIAGNSSEIEIPIPVRADEKPNLIVNKPQDGGSAVEGTPLYVQLEATDDVAIDSVFLKADYGNGQTAYTATSKQAPFTFMVPIPARSGDALKDKVQLTVEVLDSYGAKVSDPGHHRVTQTLSVNIVEDHPPSIAIARPEAQKVFLEGQTMIVEVNAVDDVGLASVTLEVQGFPEGTKSFTDLDFPYQFAVPLPFGIGGRDLILKAKAQEIRASGTPRSVEAALVSVRVERDLVPPELLVVKPVSSDATITENRSFDYEFTVTDNVAVGMVKAQLYADRNQNGQFEEGEEIQQRIHVSIPYSGTLTLAALKDYVSADVNQLAMQLQVTAVDSAGNKANKKVALNLVKNRQPEVKQLLVLDSFGEPMGTLLSSVTEGRNVIIRVDAQDFEQGVDAVKLYQEKVDGSGYQALSEDATLPFEFSYSIPKGSANVGRTLRWKATARDVDGHESQLSVSPVLSFKIAANQPPAIAITQPQNEDSVIIEGQMIDVTAEVFDDQGREGIDRVVFTINDQPVLTQTTAASRNLYRASLSAPQGVDGFLIQAIAYDRMGAQGQSKTVRVGKIKDTVAPRVAILNPINRDILTTAETLRLVVQVDDVGVDSDRHVLAQWIREYQDSAGRWVTLWATPAIQPWSAEPADPSQPRAMELIRNDARDPQDTTPVSAPDDFRYIYWADFADGKILQRGGYRNERVRLITQVQTPQHTVTQEATFEVGYGLAARRFLSVSSTINPQISQSVYYSAVDEYKAPDRQGALVAAWSTQDPLQLEKDFGLPSLAKHRTGLFILDPQSEAGTGENGDLYVFEELLVGSSETFSGTIGEIKVNANFLAAAKSGNDELAQDPVSNAFASALDDLIRKDWESPNGPGQTGTGRVDSSSDAGELLLFNNRNGEGQFGLAYQLQGRIEFSYPDVYGFDIRDQLAFVANGLGGVQVIDISSLSHPYKVGTIKPDGISRDVKVQGKFAFIAASQQGLVVVDLSRASLPIVASLDTAGIANRMSIVGHKLYLTNMLTNSGEAVVDIIDITDPLIPRMLRSIDLRAGRADLVSRGAYAVALTGGMASVTVHYQDQMGKAAQSLVEMIDLSLLPENSVDATTPVMVQRQVGSEGGMVRGLVKGRGGLHVAAGRQGIAQIEINRLTVLSHQPLADEEGISTDIEDIQLELSADVTSTQEIKNFVKVYEQDVRFGVDITNDFAISFVQQNGQDNRRLIRLQRQRAELVSNTVYVVVLKSGLAPTTGLPMSADYEFRFITSPHGTARPPAISSICSVSSGSDCRAIGPTRGGTAVVIRGQHFSDSPKVFFGNREAQVEKVETDAQTSAELIHVRTPASVAGPVSVSVRNRTGLEDIVVGGFIYTDQLQINFVTPSVVNVSQVGEGQTVEVVGFGFHSKIQLRATVSDPNSTLSRIDVPGSDRLTLLSSERLRWVVPDFGSSYRGFLDLEVSDASGQRFVLPQALFMGDMQPARVLLTDQPFTMNELTSAYEEGNPLPFERIPDITRLPPGQIVSTAVDDRLGLIYVLGAGAGGQNPGNVVSSEELRRYVAPGWISLVKYERDSLQNAAPLHQLGYYNLPQDLEPIKILLGPKHVYVLAAPQDLPHVDSAHKGRNWLLVYDRETREWTDSDQLPQAKDRDILYRVPLDLNGTPIDMQILDQLLAVRALNGAVHILSLVDPAAPAVVRRLETFQSERGLTALLSKGMQILSPYLVVNQDSGSLVFDLSHPLIPQLPSIDKNFMGTLAQGTGAIG